MNENTPKDVAIHENTWMKFLLWAAKFAGSNSSATGMGTADWVGMTSTQSQLNSLGGRI